MNQLTAIFHNIIDYFKQPFDAKVMGQQLLSLFLQYRLAIVVALSFLFLSLQAYKIFKKIRLKKQAQLEKNALFISNAENLLATPATAQLMPLEIDENPEVLFADEMQEFSESPIEDDTIEDLTGEIARLTEDIVSTEAEIKTAIDTVNPEDMGQSQDLFKQLVQRGEINAKQTAKAYRYLGTIAYFENIQDALSAYRRATELDPTNLKGWYLLGQLLNRIGQLNQAKEAYQTLLTLGKKSRNPEKVAQAYNNLGNIYLSQSELDKAIEMYQKALRINETFHKQLGIAANYGNLGCVYYARGDLDKAINYHQQALAIDESLNNHAAMAEDYGNLGLLYKTRGEWGKAIDMHNHALEINLTLGHKEAIAANYGNLGNVYKTRGDVNKAFEMHTQALQIDEAMENKQGMAANYGNLGIIYKIRGELDKAIEMHAKALHIDESIGNQHGVAEDYGNLGLVYQKHGDLDKAIEFHKKGLAIQKALGDKLGMAAKYGNLGNIYRAKRDKDLAKRYYQKSIALFQLFDCSMAQTMQEWLDKV